MVNFDLTETLDDLFYYGSFTVVLTTYWWWFLTSEYATEERDTEVYPPP